MSDNYNSSTEPSYITIPHWEIYAQRERDRQEKNDLMRFFDLYQNTFLQIALPALEGMLIDPPPASRLEQLTWRFLHPEFEHFDFCGAANGSEVAQSLVRRLANGMILGLARRKSDNPPKIPSPYWAHSAAILVGCLHTGRRPNRIIAFELICCAYTPLREVS